MEKQTMPQLKVSNTQTGPWLDTISVELDKRLSLWYKITLDGKVDSIRIVYPIYDGDVELSIREKNALMDRDQWNNVSLVTLDLDSDDISTSDDLPGVYYLSSLQGKNEILFQLSQGETLKSDADILSNKAVCYIEKKSGRKWVELDEVTISKKLTLPSVVSFTADRSVLVNGESPILSWNVVDASKIRISSQFYSSHDSNKIHSSWNTKKDIGSGLAKTTLFTLIPDPDSYQVIKETISIEVYTESQIATKANRFDGQKLMGLYTLPFGEEEKMIALVLHDHDENIKKNVLVWESFDGLEWEKSVAYSKIPAFIDDVRNSANVPLDFAGSPGVVYQNKLYLIGGSRFNPNMRSNEVYFYDFGYEEKGWQKGGNAGFTPRMGHTCVVYNKEIWVLGGSDSRGATDSCWIFDGAKWTESQNNKLPVKRCMASAMVVDNQIQLFGGFGDLPGFPDQTINDACCFDSSSWKNFTWDGVNDQIFSACCVFECKGERFILSTGYVDSTYKSELRIIGNTSFAEVTGINIPVSDSYFNIQPVTFKDVVWMCITTQDVESKSTDLKYFVYVK